MTSTKIVVVGSVDDGDFNFVFSKIAALHTKNNFTLAIVVGNLFGTSSQVQGDSLRLLLSGATSVPIPTYFGLASNQLPEQVIAHLQSTDDGSLCENLFYLGKRTTISTSEGVRIVGLGGVLDDDIAENVSKDKFAPFYKSSDARTLKGAINADVLVTAEWPENILRGSKIASSQETGHPSGRSQIAELCRALKPRYHFSISPSFFEREPFFHTPSEDEPDYRPLTRFISLASARNLSKQKWLYAFTLSKEKPVTLPSGTTACPFPAISAPKRSLDQGFSRYSSDTYRSDRPSKRARRPPPGPDECFFCLSNPDLASHLITSIGDEAYLTTAKGPLATKDTFDGLDFPGHMLIIPLAHTPSLFSISDIESRESCSKEMTKYRDALSNMVASKSSQRLGSVTWEVSRESGVHTHWQFLPFSAPLIRKGLVKTAFRVEAENLSYPAFKDKEAAVTDGDVFRLWLWVPLEMSSTAEDKAKGHLKCLVLPLSPSVRFDVQFGRRVLAKLLKLDDRTNWKDCAQVKAEEVLDVEAFKKAFEPFDFSSIDE
ncbi:MAG: hypothetical protein M1814_005585 [Vezdaea aestivalis]|nr:MAG: hypothetical protein M1814_005585 [Vezdaea aestivalis]